MLFSKGCGWIQNKVGKTHLCKRERVLYNSCDKNDIDFSALKPHGKIGTDFKTALELHLLSSVAMAGRNKLRHTYLS